MRLFAAAWLASAAAALYLTGRSAWQLAHDPGQRAGYRSRGEVLGRRMGIALALMISILFPPLTIVLTCARERQGRGP